jgi:hypothetical protein
MTKYNNKIPILKEMFLWIKMVADPAFNIKFVTVMLRSFKKISIDFLKAHGFDTNAIALD